MMTTSKKRSVPLSQSTAEKTAKRRKRTYFNDEQLDRLEQTFHEDMFPGIDKRETLARELGIGEDRIHVWFQNRRSRWRKREIKNKPAPVTNPAQVQANNRLEPWVPDQFLPYCHPPNFLPTSGAAHVPSCDNFWGINSSSYYFPSQFPATNTAHSSAFTGPSFSFIYPPVSPPTSSQITTTEQAPYSGQGSQQVSPLFYDSDSTESRHSSDEYLAAMGLLSVFNREN